VHLVLDGATRAPPTLSLHDALPILGSKAGGAPGALVKLDNDGNFLEAHPAPDYMYDVGVKPELNLIVTSSWAHPHAVKAGNTPRSEEHTSELQSRFDLVCRLLLEQK